MKIDLYQFLCYVNSVTVTVDKMKLNEIEPNVFGAATIFEIYCARFMWLMDILADGHDFKDLRNNKQ